MSTEKNIKNRVLRLDTLIFGIEANNGDLSDILLKQRFSSPDSLHRVMPRISERQSGNPSVSLEQKSILSDYWKYVNSLTEETNSNTRRRLSSTYIFFFILLVE